MLAEEIHEFQFGGQMVRQVGELTADPQAELPVGQFNGDGAITHQPAVIFQLHRFVRVADLPVAGRR